ncbi:MAG TPA: hypothetical protein VKA45_08915 [Gaiellaceae bacterium]|nr:hypothetical protein [Gaiellaceae bacterium]
MSNWTPSAALAPRSRGARTTRIDRGRALGREAKQGRLPDAGLGTQDEALSRARSGAGEDALDRLALPLPTSTA